jgi:hypothetical protein
MISFMSLPTEEIDFNCLFEQYFSRPLTPQSYKNIKIIVQIVLSLI